MSYIDRLISNCNLAKAAEPIKVIDVGESTELDQIRSGIYVIEEVEGDPQETFSSFIRYKARNERKCAKPNAPSRVLYVGSSTTGVGKRIEQHLGFGHKGTYALNLRFWFKGRYKITVKQFDVSREVLQIIEDDLSDRLRPAFGKQGGNGR